MALQDLLGKLQNVKPAGKEIRANCPACGDTKAHLYLTTSDTGQVLMHCQKNTCSADSILSAIGLKKSDLFPPKDQPARKEPEEKPIKTTYYDIIGTNGELVAQHVRFDYAHKDKDFRWFRNGKWKLDGLPVTSLPLYGLKWALNESFDSPGDWFVCEGEKATDALHEAGYIALGTVTGASAKGMKLPSRESLQILADRQGRIILWPDNDEPGKHHMELIAKALHEMGKEDVFVIEWPEAPLKGDAYDFVKGGGDMALIIQRIRRVSVYCLGQTNLSLERDKNGTVLSCPDGFENMSEVSRNNDYVNKDARYERDKNGTENGTNDPPRTENGTPPPESHSEKFSGKIVEWVKGTTGWWETRELDSEIGVYSLKDKENRKKVLQRLKERGTIESHPKINKQWRYVNVRSTSLNFKTATDSGVLDFKWPLGIEQYVNLYPGNMAVVAGAPNSGKTAMMLNLVYLNQCNHPVYYFCSEMGAVELRSRLEMFPGMSIDDWHFEAIERASDFADVIRPDCVNIIDFLEMTTELYLVNTYLTAINQKLKSGIAVVALQKKVGAAFGRGLEFGLEKPKLYLSMDKGKIQIIKGKSWAKQNVDPAGLQATFKIIGGCEFRQTKDWYWD